MGDVIIRDHGWAKDLIQIRERDRESQQGACVCLLHTIMIIQSILKNKYLDRRKTSEQYRTSDQCSISPEISAGRILLYGIII